MNRPEQDLQRAVAQLLDNLGWLWCHVPNGGARSKAEAAILKGLGVKAGVPDILIFEQWAHDTGQFTFVKFGVAIELKAKGRRVKPGSDQETWLHELRQRGWYCDECDDVDYFIEIIKLVKPQNGRCFR